MAAIYDMGTIDQGATWRRRVRWLNAENNPISLSGYTDARMHVRKTVTSAGTEVELTIANGKASIADNAVHLTLTAAQTSALDGWEGPAVYDIELVDAAGEVYRLLQGTIYFDPEVTR